MGRKIRWGLLVPFPSEQLGPQQTQRCLGQAEAYFRTKWHPDPSNRLATIDMGRKMATAAVPLSVGVLGTHLTQCRLGQG